MIFLQEKTWTVILHWVKSCWLHQCLCDYWFSNCGFGDKSQQLMRRWSRGQTEGGGELLSFKRQGRKPAADSNNKHCINMMCVYVCVRALHLHVRSFGCCSWADLMLRRGSVISIHRGIKHKKATMATERKGEEGGWRQGGIKAKKGLKGGGGVVTMQQKWGKKGRGCCEGDPAVSAEREEAWRPSWWGYAVSTTFGQDKAWANQTPRIITAAD